MEKCYIIGKIFKILPMIEGFDNGCVTKEELDSYISKQYIQFNGLDIDDKIKTDVLITLKGIKNSYTSVDIKDIKSSVLRLTNMIDRGL